MIVCACVRLLLDSFLWHGSIREKRGASFMKLTNPTNAMTHKVFFFFYSTCVRCAWQLLRIANIPDDQALTLSINRAATNDFWSLVTWTSYVIALYIQLNHHKKGSKLTVEPHEPHQYRTTTVRDIAANTETHSRSVVQAWNRIRLHNFKVCGSTKFGIRLLPTYSR